MVIVKEAGRGASRPHYRPQVPAKRNHFAVRFPLFFFYISVGGATLIKPPSSARQNKKA